MVHLLAWRRALRLSITGAGILAALALPASAQLVFDSNFIYNNGSICSNDIGGTDSCSTDYPSGYSDCDMINSIFPENHTTDDPLLNPQILNMTNPRWDPQAGSPVLGKNGAVLVDVEALDPWFTNVCYAGAVPETGGNPANDWTVGWTWYGQDGCTPEVLQAANEGRPVKVINGDITSNYTFYADSVYTLNGRIAVVDGVTLTIQPGTLVVGALAGLSYLILERGGNIDAQGTAEAPIVFTSAAPCGQQNPSDWGGVVIMGNARANCASLPPPDGTGCAITDGVNVCESEGNAGIFGGTDDSDNSGIMRYCRIEYSGRELAPDNELNVLTMNAVGSGTTLEYIQTHRGADDGFEWFGGTAHLRHIVATSNNDDNLDWQMGFRGRVQFAVVRQNSDDGADRGIEADNNEWDHDCPLESNPIMANLTLVGVLDGSGVGTAGVNLRRGTNGTVVNSIIYGFSAQGLDVDNLETLDNCPGPVPAKYSCPTSDVGPAGERHAFEVTAGPNPSFGPSTLAFVLDQEENVTVRIFDASGRLVDTVLSGRLQAGPHRLPWAPENGASGAYFYQVRAGAQKASGRILYLH